MKKLSFLSAIFYLLFITHLSISQWIWQNPLPQGCFIRDVKFVNANTGWTVGETGLIMKTVNGGINWMIQKSWTIAHINSVFFVNSNIGYCTGTFGKILKTINGGTNWIILESGTTNIEFLDIFFTSPDTGYISSDMLIKKTIDGGISWIQQQCDTTKYIYSVFFINNNTGWLTGRFGKVLKTTNGGTNWVTQITPTTKHMRDIFFLDSNIGWAVGQDSTLIKTTNSGMNWFIQNVGFHTDQCQRIKFVNPNTGWLTTLNSSRLSKTTDGGYNWVSYVFTLFLNSSLDFVDINTGWYIGEQTIYKTTVGGTSWTSQSSQFFGFYNLKSIFAPSVNIAYIVADFNNQIYKTTNGGNNWFPQSIGVSNNTFNTNYFINDNTGWIAGNKGFILKTVNGGNNWIIQKSDSTLELKSIKFIDLNTGWVFGRSTTLNGIVYKTTNSGNNWIFQTNFSSNYLNSGFMLDMNTGYAVGSGGIFVKTTNGGTNWNTLPSGVTLNLYSLYFINSNTGWIVGAGIIRYTTNGGMNWIAQNASVLESLYSITFSGNDTGVICGSRGTIMKTTNKGINWITKNYGISPELSSIFYANSQILWTVGTRGAVLKNTSAGENEFYDNSNYRNNLNQNIPPFSTIQDSIYMNIPGNVVMVNWALDTVIYAPDSNLVFTLIHNGIYDTLIYQAGGGGSNFIQTKISDTSTIPITMGSPPFSDTYRPYKPLSMFTGAPAGGLWILRISSKGMLKRTGVIKSWGITVSYNILTGIKTISQNIPGSFKLYQNYPNPFNPETRIRYDLKSKTNVLLNVYDILGRKIMTLVNANQSAGTYEVTFDGRSFASSVYFYKLEAGDFKETKKMILIK